MLGVVVLVFDVDIAALVLIFVFILKVVAAWVSAFLSVMDRCVAYLLLLLVRVLHEIIVVGHCGGVVVR